MKQYLIDSEELSLVNTLLERDGNHPADVEELPPGGKWLTREDVEEVARSVALAFLDAEFSTDEIDPTTQRWVDEAVDELFEEDKR